MKENNIYIHFAYKKLRLKISLKLLTVLEIFDHISGIILFTRARAVFANNIISAINSKCRIICPQIINVWSSITQKKIKNSITSFFSFICIHPQYVPPGEEISRRYTSAFSRYWQSFKWSPKCIQQFSVNTTFTTSNNSDALAPCSYPQLSARRHLARTSCRTYQSLAFKYIEYEQL